MLRYVLTANAPETKDNDFTWKDFQSRNNNELLAVYGNFVNRTLVLTHKYFEGVVPEMKELTEKDHETLNLMNGYPDRIAASIGLYRFREALSELMNLARLGNKYLTENEPWKIFKTDPQRVKTILAVSLQIVAKLMVLSEPFLPFSAAKLTKMMRLDHLNWNQSKETLLVAAGHQLGEVDYLFEKIEDEAIEFQIQKLLATKKANQEAAESTAEAPSYPPQKESITYDDFAKMDLRTGTIIAAEAMPKAKKLLKLTVDTGLDQRTVVSGIAEHYRPENIIGQKVVMLINLIPRELRGVSSQGMILMAENSAGKLCFVSPDEAFHNGSEVK